jgi:hypothetical protein
MMARGHYTVEEANALLPFLAPALVELREKYEEAQRIRVAIARAAASNGRSQASEDDARGMARVAELLERIEEWGLVLRDVSTGLVDFPARSGGEDVLLCWRLGEPEVAYWHSPEDGFAGRRPLTDL